MKRFLRTLLAALVILLVALALFSGWKIYSIQRGYQDAADRYDSLSGSVVAAPSAGVSAGAPAAAAEPDGTDADVIVIDEPAPEAYSPISVDFDALREISPNVIGWLCLPDTVISYPVAQSTDNAYYLDRFLDGTPNVGGTLFADFACPSDFSGQNTIIYGHNMRNGSMFALIDDYTDQAFYDMHPYLYLNTPLQNYRVEVFAGFTTDPESFVYATAFASEEDFAAYLNAVRALSDFSSPVAVAGSDRIVSLSTCTYSADDVRFVLFGKLVEIG